MVYGTITAYQQKVPNVVTKLVDGEPQATITGERHFGSPLASFPFTDTKVYIALTALLLNVLVAVLLTLLFRATRAPAGTDATDPTDYYADAPSGAVLAPGEFEGEEAFHGAGAARTT
jgi:SSS family solute:Na+ symporter